ncbi:MAG: LysR substrate-binding domain-containing protein [Anaerolineae bacterium]|jgi:DNA-binding transcriptional LysR family regulator|nr:LysR substrate-binding domain-containing protein [Anaerolineae bacterium]MDH7474804.1 LysR substrate-binding domain-containing protein [Anaerolineae bacterium]
MRLAYLRTFVEVAQRKSFSAAAQALGISQPAVSQQMRRLEEELGVRLLLREGRGPVVLTESGKVVLDFARSTLAAYDALRTELRRLEGEIAGILRLAASTTPGEYLVPQLLAAFRGQYPGVEAQVTVSDTADAVQRVRSGACDLGFIGAPVEGPGLILERLAADEIVLAVYPEHPFAGRKRVSWEEVLAQPLIMREEGSGTRRTVESALMAQGKTLPRESIALTLGSTQAVVQAIRDELGIGFVSALAITRVPPAERLPTVAIEDLTLTRDLFIIYDEARITTHLLRTFVAFARAWARERETT